MKYKLVGFPLDNPPGDHHVTTAYDADTDTMTITRLPPPVQGTAATMSKAIGDAVKSWPSIYAPPIGDTLDRKSTDAEALRRREERDTANMERQQRRQRIDETARAVLASMLADVDVDADDDTSRSRLAYEQAFAHEHERDQWIKADRL